MDKFFEIVGIASLTLSGIIFFGGALMVIMGEYFLAAKAVVVGLGFIGLWVVSGVD